MRMINDFDLMIGYNLLKGIRSYQKLKKVIIDEELVSEEEVELIDVGGTWRNANYDLFFKYAFNDVRFIYLIDEKLEIIDYFFEIKMTFGLEDMEKTMAYSSPIDTVLLKFAKKEFNYVLPDARQTREEEGNQTLEGAVVFQAPKGLFDNVAVYDFSRFYPAIILALNLSPENVDEDKTVRCLVPEVAKEFIKERDKFDKILNTLEPSSTEWKIFKRKRDAKKGCLNALYGIHGAKFSRLYNLRVANKITGTARDGIEFVRIKAAEKEFKTLYGDTDSIFIQTDTIARSIQMESILNEAMKDFADKIGASQYSIKLKLEKFYRRIGFGGMKKRYFGRITWQDGKPTDKIDIVGFEEVRSDSASITKRLQKLLFKLLLYHQGEETVVTIEVSKIIRQVHNMYKSNKYKLSEIALPKGMNKKLSEYKTRPNYVRGVDYVKEYLPNIGSNINDYEQIFMFFIKRTSSKYPKTDVISCSTEDISLVKKLIIDGFEVDWKKHFDRTVRNPMSSIMDILNLNIDEVLTGIKQSSLASFIQKDI